MNQITLSSQDIHCETCAASVTKALNQVEGVQDVKVDIDAKVVTVTYDSPAQPEALRHAMDEAGFEVSNN